MVKTLVSLGADPEVFFAKNHTPVSAIGKIGGSKYEPKKVGDEGFAILEDNVAAEFNIPPATEVTTWEKNITQGLSIVEQYAKNNGCTVSLLASHSFDKKELDNPQAQEFGCEPDYNAWTGTVNESPKAPDSSLRACGGHVHVGGITDLNPLAVVRFMDLFLGCPSLILDSDTTRRQLYGKAGAFRPTEYGVEYRVLSNFWIFSSDLRKWVWRSTLFAVEWARNRAPIEEDSTTAKLIKECINDSNYDAWQSLIKTFPEIKPNLRIAA